MVSLSNWATLALIGGGILAFYKLGGASGIGSRIGGGFSNLFDSFTSALNLKTSTVDPYQTWLDSYGTGTGILDVVKKGDKFCVGGTAGNPSFCFDENPNLVENRDPRILGDEATTVNTGGFIQTSTGDYQTVQQQIISPSLPAYVGSLDYVFSGSSASSSSSLASGWDSSSLKGVNITGSYTSSSSGGGGRSGGSSGGGSSGGGSSGGSSSGSGSGGSSSSSSGGSSSSSSGGSSSSSSGGSSSSSSGGSSGGSTGGGTGSRGGQGAGRSSNRGR
jgi:hypothetical protein